MVAKGGMVFWGHWLVGAYGARPDRKLVAVRIGPDKWHLARVAAVTAKKTMGQWLEEAIGEKLERGKGDRKRGN